jgi:Ser/Thr protein kinase RdoA (MazF antagonist)
MAERDYLPETPEELTAAWLSDVLGTEIANVQREILGDEQGFMGDVVRLELESSDSQLPRYVVAKLPKKANRVMGELLGVYEREIMFFREFSEELPIRAPQLYFSEFDRDRGSEKQKEILRAIDRWPAFLNRLIGWLATHIAAAKKRRYLLLIEFYEGMEPGDQLAGVDLAACQRVLRGIAPMHSRYWDDPVLDQHFWLLDFDIDARMRQGTFLQHVDSYASVMGDSIAPHLNWLRDHGESLVRQFHAEAPRTLLHCDLRLDNVIFDGDECAYIDFQLVRCGPAAYDVAYFITSALQETVTDAERETVLRDYHAALAAPDYEYAAFKRDYQRALMIILSTLSSTEDVQLGDNRGQTMMDAWLRRLRTCVEGIDPATLLH